MIREMSFVAAISVFCIGLYCVLTDRNLIKICVGLSIMESSIVLLLVAIAYREGGLAPVFSAEIETYVDPVPHALALTAIVIGAGVTAVALGLSVLIYRHFGTLNIDKIWRSLG
jgi:multisubunit Na+/H+ antiporter MnhC subunit